jgi:hypothetical protein
MFAIQFVAAAAVMAAFVASGGQHRTASSDPQTETIQPRDPTAPTFVPRSPNESRQLPPEATPFSRLFEKTLRAPGVSPLPGAPAGPQRPMDSCGMMLWMGDGSLDPKIGRVVQPNANVDFKIRTIVPPVCVPTTDRR